MLSQDLKYKFLKNQQDFQVNTLIKNLDALLSGDYVSQSDFAQALDDFIRTNCVISTDQSQIILRKIQSILRKPLARPSSNVDLVEEVEEAKEETANAD